jgi:hypothetical protein
MKKIIVKVTKQGKVSVRTEGFTGSSCMEASKRIEDLLGKATKVDQTAEYYQNDACVMEDVCQQN